MTTSTALMKTGEEWLKSAMADDTVVAELLVRMKQSHASPPENFVQILAPPSGWGVRLPRSRPSVSGSRCDVYADSRRKEASDSARRSPVTPLCWSGGSGSSDGFEESSTGRRCSSGSRSKIIGANDDSSIISGRSRKKSFTELKDEESLLLKESISLKKVSPIDEISTLHTTCIEHRVTNESLKKIKLDLNDYDVQQRATSRHTQLGAWPTLPNVFSTLATQPACFGHSQSDHHELVEKAGPGSSRDNSFLLPDLNMMPGEDDSGSETLYGMSR